MDAKQIVNNQRNFFKSHQTLGYTHRKNALEKLREAIYKYEDKLVEALGKDLGKNPSEAYMTEIGIVLKELTYMQKKLKKFMKPKKVKTHITDFPGNSFRYPDPYGVTLIISPWNYPVNLTLCPLIGAIASGNTAIIKPSEYSQHTSAVLEKMIKETFSPSYITVVNGGIETNQALLDQKMDYIFFTGSTNVGRIVMQKASKYLTPISLELGGKSPVIVGKDANVKIAAKRITFGKFLNAGQTCIAPDYLYIHESVKTEFIEEFKKKDIPSKIDEIWEFNNSGLIITNDRNRKGHHAKVIYTDDFKFFKFIEEMFEVLTPLHHYTCRYEFCEMIAELINDTIKVKENENNIYEDGFLMISEDVKNFIIENYEMQKEIFEELEFHSDIENYFENYVEET